MTEVTYKGVYQSLRAIRDVEGLRVGAHLSFEVRGGLSFVRSTHGPRCCSPPPIMVHLAPRSSPRVPPTREAKGSSVSLLLIWTMFEGTSATRLPADCSLASGCGPHSRQSVGDSRGIGNLVHWVRSAGDPGTTMITRTLRH